MDMMERIKSGYLGYLNEINGIRIKLGMIPLKDLSYLPQINRGDEFEDDNDLIDGEMGLIDISPEIDIKEIISNIHILFDPDYIGINQRDYDSSFRIIELYNKDQIGFRYGKEI